MLILLLKKKINNHKNNYYYGYENLILDQDLYKNKTKNRKNILFHFGGTDKFEILKKIISYNLIDKNNDYKIIIGPQTKLNTFLKKKILKYSNVKIFNNPKKISSIYANIDFAVISGGITLFNIA